jgi:hypothetical protein
MGRDRRPAGCVATSLNEPTGRAAGIAARLRRWEQSDQVARINSRLVPASCGVQRGDLIRALGQHNAALEFQ